MATHESSSILNPRQSPFSWANDRESKVFYEVLLEFPKRLARFNKAMTTQEAQLPVLGMFPFASLATMIDNAIHSRHLLSMSLVALQIKRETESTNVTGLGG
jgi:hypothetical protein